MQISRFKICSEFFFGSSISCNTSRQNHFRSRVPLPLCALLNYARGDQCARHRQVDEHQSSPHTRCPECAAFLVICPDKIISEAVSLCHSVRYSTMPEEINVRGIDKWMSINLHLILDAPSASLSSPVSAGSISSDHVELTGFPASTFSTLSAQEDAALPHSILQY